MSIELYFKKESFADFSDFSISFSHALFKIRAAQNKSLRQVSRKTGLSIAEIDALETFIGDINFVSVMRLLDYYHAKLEIDPACFPDLPAKIAAKYLC